MAFYLLELGIYLGWLGRVAGNESCTGFPAKIRELRGGAGREDHLATALRDLPCQRCAQALPRADDHCIFRHCGYPSVQAGERKADRQSSAL